MASLAERLQAVEAARLGKQMRWMAVKAAFELDAGHASGSQRDHLHCHRCGELDVRLDAVRPALGALLDGRQPSGAQRRRRNNALHLAAGGRRIGTSASGSGGSGGVGSGGSDSSDHQRAPATTEPLDEFYGISTVEGDCQTSASFPPDADVWFGSWAPLLQCCHQCLR